MNKYFYQSLLLDLALVAALLLATSDTPTMKTVGIILAPTVVRSIVRQEF